MARPGARTVGGSRFAWTPRSGGGPVGDVRSGERQRNWEKGAIMDEYTVMNKWDYDGIRTFGKKNKVPVRDLMALGLDADPFYVNPVRIRKAEWFTEIIQKHFSGIGSIHTRRVHYRIQNNPQWNIKTPDISDLIVQKNMGKNWNVPYQNIEDHWDILQMAAKDARLLGLIPYEQIVDMRNKEAEVNAVYTFNDELNFQIHANTEVDVKCWPSFEEYDRKNHRYYHCELLIEKATMNDVLIPICQKYGINLSIGTGQMSLTRIYELMVRSIQSKRPVRIFYVSDFDNAGQFMVVQVARYIQFWLNKWNMDYDITLEPIVLTKEQVEKYQLPKSPDNAESTELDALEALHPGELGSIIESWLSKFVDLGLEEKIDDEISEWEEDQREALDSLQEKFDGRVQALRLQAEALTDEIVEHINAHPEAFDDPPELTEASPSPEDEYVDWFFDGMREYLTQNKYYQDFRERMPTRIFRCKECNATFTSTHDLKAHKKAVHR
jgi:hypothetical protein